MARRLEHAGPGGLAALKAEVLAANFAAQSLAQQTRSATATAQNTEVALHAAQHEARRAVDDFTRDFYERKIFEKDLRFASAEDERAYREREEQRRREIEKARAEDTPEGDLRAVRLAKEQLLDAGAHGADSNPDYAPMVKRMDDAEQKLAAQMPRHQQAVEAEAVDPLDAVAPSQNVPPAIIATLRAAGVTTPPSGEGHGLTQKNDPIEPSRGRV